VAEALRKQGGVVLDGSPPLDIPLSTTLEELKGKKFSTVICTVKTYAVESALNDLQKSGLKFDELVAFQNGWGTDELYVEAFPNTKFWVLTTTRAVGCESVGRLAPAKKGGLAIAPWKASLPMGIPNSIRKVKLPFITVERGIDLKWSKLLLNVIGNATGAVTGLSPQQLANHPELMKTELLLAREAIAVGKAIGVRRVDLPDFPIQLLSLALDKLPIRLVSPIIAAKMRGARGEKLPSLFFDLEDPTSPTEIDHLNGAVVEEGLRHEVSTPKQKALLDLFHRCRADQELWTSLRREPRSLMDYV
jgi:2-dehydropantoate 2-reductase